MLRSFRKPLIIMTPKSLLRHKLAVSQRSDFIGEAHFRRIMSDRTPPADKDVKRVVLCSGKVGYDLMEARDAAGLTDTRSQEHTSELQSLMRISYAVFCLKKKQETQKTYRILHFNLKQLFSYTYKS